MASPIRRRPLAPACSISATDSCQRLGVGATITGGFFHTSRRPSLSSALTTLMATSVASRSSSASSRSAVFNILSIVIWAVTQGGHVTYGVNPRADNRGTEARTRVEADCAAAAIARFTFHRVLSGWDAIAPNQRACAHTRANRPFHPSHHSHKRSAEHSECRRAFCLTHNSPSIPL
jgi:hypothetical protein